MSVIIGLTSWGCYEDKINIKTVSGTEFCYLSVGYYSSSFAGENEGELGKVKFIAKYKKLNDNTVEATIVTYCPKYIHEKSSFISFNPPTAF